MSRNYLYLISIAFLAAFAGCTKSSSVIDKIIKSPSVYIESLKHPSEFPDEYLPEVLNIEEILAQNPLGKDENVKILLLSESQWASNHFVQVRNGEVFNTHFHKKHDKTIYIKKGEGIAILNGTRYFVKPGTVLQVPNNTRYKFNNTGDDVYVALSVFTPPFDGTDITYIKEIEIEKPKSEAVKEKEKLEKGLAKRKKSSEKKEGENMEKFIYNSGKTEHPPADNSGFSSSSGSQPFRSDSNASNDYRYSGDSQQSRQTNNFRSGNEPFKKSDDIFAFEDEPGDEYDLDLDKNLDKRERSRNSRSRIGQDEWDAFAGGSRSNNKREEFMFEDFDEPESKPSAPVNRGINEIIEQLNELRDTGLITEDEYRSKMSELMNQ